MKPATAVDGTLSGARLAPATASIAPETPTRRTEPAEPWTDTRASAQALRAAQARQVSGRRRLVDPATCDRDYSDDEWEFMQAMQDYKQRSGRNFPTWSEVLEVLRALGYAKPYELDDSEADLAAPLPGLSRPRNSASA